MRLLRGSIAGAVLLTVVLLLVFARNTGHSTATPINEHEQPKVYHPPKTVKATAAQKAAAVSTLSRFVRSAVIRRDLASSWPLATAHMKEGTSHADWLSGNLPVVTYPASAFRAAGYTLKYQYKGILGYDVLVLPKETKAAQRAGQQVYACELHDVHGSWLVDQCYPRKTL
ncbi:MAG TPA: hypothetical protein VH210_16000 [Gaiellaceae bacterium]|nr:hypothetical protein [Gaiellaceae bacterium]